MIDTRLWFLFFFTCHFRCNAILDKTAQSYPIMPEDYDPLGKPHTRKGSYILEVYFRMEILEIDSINEAENLNIYMDWRDHRLVSETSSSNNYPYKEIHNFWYPLIVFDNIRGGQLYDDEIMPSEFKISPTYGQISLRQRLKLFCQMNLANYPMDTQRCAIVFGAPANPKEVYLPHWVKDLDINRNPYAIEVKSNTIDLHVFTFSLHESVQLEDNNHNKLNVSFTFKRRIVPSLISVYFPSALIVLVSFISFWIDINAIPGRVGIGVTAVLTIMTQFLSTRKSLPPVSYITAMDVWLLACISFVCAALIEFAVSHSIAKRRADAAKKKEAEAAKKAKAASLDPSSSGMILPKVSWTNRRFTAKGYMPHLDLKAGYQWTLEEEPEEESRWQRFKSMMTISNPDKFSQVVYPLGFVVFCGIYWWNLLARTKI